MQYFNQLLIWLENLARQIPLEQFALLGGFIEELLAPIPSPFVMTLTGSIAKSQNSTILTLLFLSLLSAFSKTLGAYILYLIGDKTEDIATNKLGKFIGIEKNQIESFGQYFKGNAKDYLTMFLLRAIPIMPTSPLSLIAGIIKIHLKPYLIAGFLGTTLRNLFYIYIGYLGLDATESFLSNLNSAETILKILLILSILLTLIYLYLKRHHLKK